MSATPYRLVIFPRTAFKQVRLNPFRTLVLLHHFLGSTSDLNSSAKNSASSISFELTGEKGAILLAKDPIRRKNARRQGAFAAYVKKHHDSWVAFARKNGYGSDVDPVLISGVDRTNDWAMLCYSNHDGVSKCKFITSVPPVPLWGTWDKPGYVHAKSGPPSCRPSSSNAETVSDEYSQCVFIRYWTKRKKSWVPKIMKAAAGPHNLGRKGRDSEGSPLGACYDSDSASVSDSASGSSDGCRDHDGSSLTSVDTESDIVTNNTTAVRYLSCPVPFSSVLNNPLQAKRDDFDVIADYIFEASWKLD